MFKRYWYKADWTLIIPVLFLLIIGTIMMFSTSSIIGFSNYNDSYFFIKRHLLFLLIGIVAFFIGFITPHTLYKKHIGLLCILMLSLLILTLTPLGVKIGGAQRWLNLGFLQFQPSELAKFVIIVFASIALSRPKKTLTHFVKGSVFLLISIALPLTLILMQPDLGNTGLILIVVFGLLFLSKVPLGQLLFIGSISILSTIGIILSNPYQKTRILSFLNPWADPLGKNYHMIQSLIAVGSGGLLGLGLGESKLKYFYLPLQYSDFIFAIICEEGGFFIAFFIVCLYALLLIKTYMIVKKTDAIFSFYLGMGCAMLLVIQAFMNIGVVIGLLPVTGIPLTFISYGGTSLITSLFYVGVILNISNSIELKQYGTLTS